jgi:predicted SprT family Zn-dependent metalloprotease
LSLEEHGLSFRFVSNSSFLMPSEQQLTFSFEFPEPGSKREPAEQRSPENREAVKKEQTSHSAAHDTVPVKNPTSASDATLPTTTVTIKRSALIRGRRLDRELTAKSRALVEGIGLPDLARLVHVLWNSRLQTTAGMADGRKQEITLNPKLLDVDPQELDGTLRHELAHLVAYYRAGNRRIQAHGPEWRRACSELGIPNEKRCHTLPFKGRQQRPKFAYQCKHCQAVYPRTRRLRRYSACYSCCREHNSGKYSNKFLLYQVSLDLLPPATD